MSFGEEYSSACRTCLVQTGTMKSIFSIEQYLEDFIPLCDTLMSITSIQVIKGDGLPEQICTNCIQEINRAFLFRKLCKKSDSTLRHYMQTALSKSVRNSSFESDTLKEDLSSFYSENGFNLKANLIGNCTKNNTAREDEDCDNKSDLDYLFKEESLDDSEDNKFENKIKNESKKKTYSCKECETVCSGLGEYRKHISHIHRQIYKCDTCSKKFQSQTVLTKHLLSHLKNNKNQINENKPVSFQNKKSITRNRNLPRTCNICNKTFRFHSNLERHKLIHTGEKPYLCNVCGKGFAQLSYLKIHSFIHTGEKPYKCKMCEKSFAAPGTLMTHIRTHTGERPHVCKICGKDFPQSGYLSAHIRTHTGEKPVECQVCHRRFNQSGRLIIHMRIHSGEKPYNCVECGRSFAVKGTLKKHIRTHTGERPYICNICGQAFAQSGTLATHMKVHKSK